jgi:hypothetical protein
MACFFLSGCHIVTVEEAMAILVKHYPRATIIKVKGSGSPYVFYVRDHSNPSIAIKEIASMLADNLNYEEVFGGRAAQMPFYCGNARVDYVNLKPICSSGLFAPK